jgi:hypothetical protein
MTDYILRKRMEKISIDRWENEGGKTSADQIEHPEELVTDKRTGGKNGSRIMRDGASHAA